MVSDIPPPTYSRLPAVFWSGPHVLPLGYATTTPHLDWWERLKSSVPIHGKVRQTVSTYKLPTLTICRRVNLLPSQYDIAFLRTAHTIYVQSLPSTWTIQTSFEKASTFLDFRMYHLLLSDLFLSWSPENRPTKRKLAFILTRAQAHLEWLHPASSDADGGVDVEFQEELHEDFLERLGNTQISAALGAWDPRHDAWGGMCDHSLSKRPRHDVYSVSFITFVLYTYPYPII